MTNPAPPPAPMIGRLTGLVLSFVVVACIGLIGFTGYLKYELDRAEATLAAPEAAINSEQDAFEKLRRALDFGGFTGLAQNFAASHDAALLPEMKAQLKQATDMAGRLPEKVSTETRHDVQAILATFAAAQDKAEKATTDPGAFVAADMAPLYAALPQLDARVAAIASANHAEAESRVQFWATLMTLISWCSLIIASAMAAGIYLSLRDRNSAPLRALSQSVKNMARGDMRTSIWGMERPDMVGEVARAVDMARYTFSQLPDMSLLSEQGPVRIRFEGNTRSLFEAMMRVISRDSEQVHQQTAALTEAIHQQQEALGQISARVEGVLTSAEARALGGDKEVRQALASMVGSAESLKHAQEHAADQLNRIVPYLQERAQGLADITQLTGKQVGQILQSLMLSERALKASAGQSDEAIKKLSSTADGLGERLFGAVNLLQASGKVLAETTEKTQSRLDEAIGKLVMPVMPMAPAPQAAAAADTTTTPRIAAAVADLEAMQVKLKELLAEQSEATRVHIDLLTTQSNGLLTQTMTASQSMMSAAERLRDEEGKLDLAIAGSAQRLSDLVDRLEQEAGDSYGKGMGASVGLSAEDQNRFRELAGQISLLSDKLTTLGQGLAQGLESLRKAPPVAAEPVDTSSLSAQLRDQWFQMAAQIEATRTGLAQTIAQQIERVETRLSQITTATAPIAGESETLRDAQQQMEQQTQILTELVATLGVLDAHMQDIRSQVAAIKAG